MSYKEKDSILIVKIDISECKKYDFKDISKVMLHEAIRNKSKYINVLFVDHSTDLIGIWSKFELEDKKNFVKEIIFNDHTKKHEVAEVLKECMQIISEINITEVVFNEFKDKVLSEVFRSEKDKLN